MTPLHKVTDHMLLCEGLVSIEEIERDGPVMNPLECYDFGDNGLTQTHDWSKTRDGVPDEPPYQTCTDCGAVRRSPWRMNP